MSSNRTQTESLKCVESRKKNSDSSDRCNKNYEGSKNSRKEKSGHCRKWSKKRKCSSWEEESSNNVEDDKNNNNRTHWADASDTWSMI